MRLLIRAEADSRIGTGHLMRCLALAQAWREGGGGVTVRTACAVPALLARLREAGAEVEAVEGEPGGPEDAQGTKESARRLGAGWVALDGYHFRASFQAALRGDGVRVLAIDDYCQVGHHAADVLLDQNLGATQAVYRSRERYTRLLLGPRFALLRGEFRQWRGWRRSVPAEASKVLVTLGGSDPDGVTLKAIAALRQVRRPGLEAIVVVGGGNPRRAELEAAARDAGDAVQLRDAVRDMAELMAWADVAVAAGGTTTWERARMGLPSLVVVLADNQAALTEAAARAGLGWNLGWHDELTADFLASELERLLSCPETRAEMARRGPSLVDGFGAVRVAGLLSGAGEPGHADLVPGE